MDIEAFESFGEQLFDLHLNPSAQMMVALLNLLAQKGIISPEEAQAVILSGKHLIDQAEYSQAAKGVPYDLMFRMATAINGGKKPA